MKIKKQLVMKKIKLILAAVIAVAGLLFTACNPTSNGNVSLVIQPADSIMAVEPGQTISWHITISPDAVERSTVGQLTVTEIRNGVSNVLVTNVYNSETTVEDDFSYTVPDDANDGEQIQIVFTATDGLSSNQATFTVTLAVNAVVYVEGTDLTFTYVSTSLDNEMMAVLSRDGISLAGGTSTTGQLAFIYVGDTTNLIHNTIASPNAQEIADAYSYNGINYTTDDKQVTFYKKVTDVTWDGVDANYINNIVLDENSTDYIAGSPNLGYGVSMLQVGDLVAFNNPQTGVKGVLKVTNIQWAKSGVKITATMTVDIKYLAYPNSSAK